MSAGVIYRVSGKTEYVNPKDNKHFSLKELQGIVGGYIEIVSLPNSMIMVINENGLSPKKVNEKASFIANAMTRGSINAIYGDVLVCDSSKVL